MFHPSVCLSVKRITPKLLIKFYMKFYEMVGHNPGTNRLNSE